MILDQSLAELKRVLDGRFEYEVIVVDNGSTDGTPDVAARHGAKVSPNRTSPSGQRGMPESLWPRASILAFVDADVFLTESWVDEFLRIRATTADVADDGHGFAVRHWAASRLDRAVLVWSARRWRRASYINSGNLVTTKMLHDAIGGFSETLATGEDVDYCHRAHAAGATIIRNVKLRTMHEGYPKTLRGFVRREMWHGQGDVGSIVALLRSRVALCAVLFCLFHLVLAYGVVRLSLPWVAVGLLESLVCALPVRCGDRTGAAS